MPATASVEPGSLTCPACGMELGPHGLDAVQEAACPSCRARLRGQVFRAWWTPRKQEPRLARAMEGEAACFFHPQNSAHLACDVCGRFVCSICDLPVGSRHLCPVCLSKGLGTDKLPEIIPQRFLWQRLSFSLGFWPFFLFIFLWPFFVVTGGTAFIAGILSFRRPGSLVRGRQRGYAITGILLALAQIAVFCGMIFFISRASSLSK